MLSRKRIMFIVKCVLTCGLVALLIHKVNWTKTWQEFEEASWLLIGLAFVFYVFGMALSVTRWRTVAMFKGFALKFSDALRYHFAGLFLNNFFPSVLGGDAFRSYLLGKSEKRYAAAASTVVFIRFVGLWATIVLFVLFGVLSLKKVFGQPLFLAFGVGLGVVLVLDVLLTLYSDRKFATWFYGFFPKRLQSFFHEMSGFTDRKFLWESFLVSMAFSLVGVGFFNLMIFWALGEHVPILPYLSVVFLTSVVSSIPVSINNIGVKEWAYYTFFPAIGINAETALAVALLGRFLQMFASLFGLPHYLRSRDDASERKKLA